MRTRRRGAQHRPRNGHWWKPLQTETREGGYAARERSQQRLHPPRTRRMARDSLDRPTLPASPAGQHRAASTSVDSPANVPFVKHNAKFIRPWTRPLDWLVPVCMSSDRLHQTGTDPLSRIQPWADSRREGSQFPKMTWSTSSGTAGLWVWRRRERPKKRRDLGTLHTEEIGSRSAATPLRAMSQTVPDMLPSISHLQFAVLDQLVRRTRGASSDRIRCLMSEIGAEREGPAFYQLMKRLEDAGLLVSSPQEFNVGGGKVIRTHYRITVEGKTAWRDTLQFYAARLRASADLL